MNEPIINPWIFYIIGIADRVHGLFIMFSVMALILATFTGVFTFLPVDEEEMEKSVSKRKPFKTFVVSTFAALFLFTLGAILPTKSTLIQMVVASYVTPANIEIIGNKLDSSLNKLVEKIIYISDRVDSK